MASDDAEAITEGLIAIARSLDRLGNADASTPMGGLEALGAVLKEAASEMTNAIDRLATAIEVHGS